MLALIRRLALSDSNLGVILGFARRLNKATFEPLAEREPLEKVIRTAFKTVLMKINHETIKIHHHVSEQ